MNKKKLIAFLAALSICVTSASIFGMNAISLPDISITASAASSGTCGENLTWTLDDDGVLTISGTGAMDNYSYSSTAPWYSEIESTIKEVVIEEGITNIGDYAFYYHDYTSLKSVTIPDSVTSIGDCAFYYCSHLKSIDIPSNLTSIGNSSFEYCSGLTSIVIPGSVTSIGERAFFKCTGLESINIGDGVTNIGKYAFCYCEKLENITISNNVASIGRNAFENTPWLENQQELNSLVIVSGILIDGTLCTGDVEIPDSVTSIGEYAFDSCTGLTSITIPEMKIACLIQRAETEHWKKHIK